MGPFGECLKCRLGKSSRFLNWFELALMFQFLLPYASSHFALLSFVVFALPLRLLALFV